MAETYELGPTRFWPRLQVVLWCAETVLGCVAFAAAIWYAAEFDDWWISLLLAVIGTMLVVMGTAMAGLSWITARAKGPVLTLSPAGLRDIRISDATIPWADIEWGLFYGPKGGHSVQVSLPKHVAVKWPMRLLARFSTLSRLPPFTVLSLGTGLNPGEIAALFHHFRDSKH